MKFNGCGKRPRQWYAVPHKELSRTEAFVPEANVRSSGRTSPHHETNISPPSQVQDGSLEGVITWLTFITFIMPPSGPTPAFAGCVTVLLTTRMQVATEEGEECSGPRTHLCAAYLLFYCAAGKWFSAGCKRSNLRRERG